MSRGSCIVKGEAEKTKTAVPNSSNEYIIDELVLEI